MRDGILAGVGWLEATTKRRLGDARAPLFVFARSGAEKSMPGMLDTILDVGMNAASVRGLIRMTGNPGLLPAIRLYVRGGGRRRAPGRFAKLTAARAQEYRRLSALQGLKGTAVTVETMVFGNSAAIPVPASRSRAIRPQASGVRRPRGRARLSLR
jgi:phosphoenolpyruvate synthase/pyruvate phosphate dikinase